MFDYVSSKWGKEKSRSIYETKKIVIRKDFWSNASDILKVFELIIKVLRLVDGDEKPIMGFIYKVTKQSIEKNSHYHAQYNDIIDNWWEYIHSELHLVGI